MTIRKWYVIRHSDSKFSVQDRQGGVGIPLQVPFDASSEREATLVCAAANQALAVELSEPVKAYDHKAVTATLKPIADAIWPEHAKCVEHPTA